MAFSIPSVISCTFRFFLAFCFLPGDSSITTKSIRETDIIQRKTVNTVGKMDMLKCLYCPAVRNGKPGSTYCKMVFTFYYHY